MIILSGLLNNVSNNSLFGNVINNSNMINEIKEGDKISSFELYNQDNQLFKINDLHGKSNFIIFFYPKDSSPGCGIEAKNFSDLVPDFDKKNVKIIGISMGTIESHKKFVDKDKLNLSLLLDNNGDVAKLFNVYQKRYLSFLPNIERTTFLVDKNFIVQKIWKDIFFLGHAKNVLEFVNKNLNIN